jgi:hypothetical protein
MPKPRRNSREIKQTKLREQAELAAAAQAAAIKDKPLLAIKAKLKTLS